MSGVVTALESSKMVCVLCGAEPVQQQYRWNAHTLVRCQQCGLLFRGEPLSLASQRRHYTAAYYTQKPAYFPVAIAHHQRHSRLRMFARVLRRLARLTSPGLLVDGGCGPGAFLAMARRAGWRAIGVDVSMDAARLTRASGAAHTPVADLSRLALASASVDAMTLFDVLGECAFPRDVVKESRRILALGGLLVVTTVDVESLVYRGAAWSYRATRGRFTDAVQKGFPADQSWFFSLDTLQALLTQEGFRILRAERFNAATEQAMALAPWWLKIPLIAVLGVGRLVGQPLECCVYAIK